VGVFFFFYEIDEWELLSSNPHYHICAAASEERVEIMNKHGERLVGLLHNTGSNKIVVLCHGFIATKVCNSLAASRNIPCHLQDIKTIT